MNRTIPKLNLFLGIATAALGLFLLSVGIGLVTIPAPPQHDDAPQWMIGLAGLVFFLGGAAVLLLALGGGDEQGNLPPDAPVWLRALQYLIVFGIAAGLASMTSWVAFGPGERTFSGNFLFFGPRANEIVGRTMFGIGAVLAWLIAAVIAYTGIVRLGRRE